MQKESSSSSSSNDDNWAAIVLDAALKVVSTGATVYVAWKMVNLLTEFLELNNQSQATAVSMATALAKRLNRPEIGVMEFDQYEQRLLNDIIGPSELAVSFKDIGGMSSELEEVQDNIILPLRYWNRQQEQRKRLSHGASGSGSFIEEDEDCRCPSGVLLYGAPGTGKSLTAKAIAKEAGATFLNIKASNVMDKYLGESDKLVSAIFRLGRKLGPTIIFIDEIETILRKRDSSNPFASAGISSMQGVFLSEWDGLNIERNSAAELQQKLQMSSAVSKPDYLYDAPVVILGATNRPMDLDSAFLRRMPVKILTKVPDLEGRRAIFQKKLASEVVAEDVDFHVLAMQTENMTGSDIAEVVRLAKQRRLKERLKLTVDESEEMTSDRSKGDGKKQRPLTYEHFAHALQKTQNSGVQTKKYSAEMTIKEIIDRGYVVEDSNDK